MKDVGQCGIGVIISEDADEQLHVVDARIWYVLLKLRDCDLHADCTMPGLFLTNCMVSISMYLAKNL